MPAALAETFLAVDNLVVAVPVADNPAETFLAGILAVAFPVGSLVGAFPVGSLVGAFPVGSLAAAYPADSLRTADFASSAAVVAAVPYRKVL